jgi:glycosyltransferase involved in cell wall biosynthesis
MKAPKVSIFIPVYNGEPFLTECIESALAQDFTDFELLIADDGSTDGTAAVIGRYAAQDGRIRWWTNPQNLGEAGNFNLCLSAARGEFIKPLYADDVLLEVSAVRQLLEVLETQPTVVLAASASYVINEHGEKIKYRDQFGRAGNWDGQDVMVRCFEKLGNLIGEPSLVMFRRSQIRHGYNGAYRQIVDLEFFFHLLEQGRFGYVAKPLAAWRRHANQNTAVNQRSGLSAQEEVRLIQEWYAKPWLQKRATRQMLFTQIRHLRKFGGATEALATEMTRQLGKVWYAAYWLKRKFSRPFAKLRQQTESHWHPVAAKKTV